MGEFAQVESALVAERVPVSVVLEGVSVGFEQPDQQQAEPRYVLRDISLSVGAGQFLAVVGKSGCGKTTILNLLAGLVEPLTGRVSVCGKTPRQARKDQAYMFARDCLLPWRSVAKNVEIGLEVRNIPKQERRKRAVDELGRVGLGSYVDRYPSELSHGMRQRAALARTWSLDPQVLLMDEPFAALDAQTREDIESQFLSIWEVSKCTVIFVTHDLLEAVFMADRVILIDEGQIAVDMMVSFPRPRVYNELTTSEEFGVVLRELRQAFAKLGTSRLVSGSHTIA
jgi:NitT/TauT family transport system ATP-binding protein